MSFRLQTILGVALIEGVLLLVLVWSSLSFLARSNEIALSQRVQTTMQLVLSTTKDAILSTDLAYLESYVQELLRNPGIAYARIKDRRLSLAEAGDEELLARAFQADTTLEAVDDDIYDVSGVIEEAGQIYGQVELGFSVDEIRRTYETARQRMSAIAVSEMVLVALFSFALGSYLTRQLKRLHEASHRIADGGPGVQVEVAGSTELADTARAFNLMSSRLKSLYDKLVQSYEELVAAVSDGVLVVSADSRIVECNAAAMEIFQGPRAQIQGRSVQELLPAPFDVFSWSPAQREFQGCALTGVPLDLDVSVTPLEMEGHGDVLLCIVRNITERKKAQRQIEEDAERLEAQNKELQDFAYVASHDLQEPLRKVRTYGDMLDEEFAPQLPDTARHYIDRMQDAAERMQLLISDLLSYSRVNTMTRPFDPVPLNDLVADVLADLDVAIHEAGATLDVAPLPTVMGDPTQLRQLFQNLIANAVKFRHPNHAPNVRIEADIEPAAGDAAGKEHCIRVIDDGIGFDPQFSERIFEVFERLHAKQDYPGTGMGLAICRKIALRHGGTLDARAADGGGSVFEVRLPMDPATSSKEDNAKDS